jgi:hypothetical protein
MRSLVEIEQIIDKLARQINAPFHAMPTYNNSRHDGTPDIEVGDSLYYYRAFDRGTVSLNRQTDNVARLLYWVFEGITSMMASDYVREHRNSQISSRYARFEYQLMLLDKINHEWKELREKEIEEIIKNSPY